MKDIHFCTSLDEFLNCYRTYENTYNIKPILSEKNKCVVASYGPGTTQTGDFLALPFRFLDHHARSNGINTSNWN